MRKLRFGSVLIASLVAVSCGSPQVPGIVASALNATRGAQTGSREDDDHDVGYARRRGPDEMRAPGLSTLRPAAGA